MADKPAPPAAPPTEAQRQIARAKALELDRYELAERVTANREYLRLMDKNEALTEDEGAWLDDFYPEKSGDAKRSKEQIEATKKLKEAARKEAAAARNPAAA